MSKPRMRDDIPDDIKLQSYALTFCMDNGLSKEQDIPLQEHLQRLVRTYANEAKKNNRSVLLFDAKSSENELKNLENQIWGIKQLSFQQKINFIAGFRTAIKHPDLESILKNSSNFSNLSKETDEWMDSRGWMEQDKITFKNAVLPLVISHFFKPHSDLTALRDLIAKIAAEQDWKNTVDLADDYLKNIQEGFFQNKSSKKQS